MGDEGMSLRRDRIRAIIAALCRDKGEVHYTDLAARTNLAPSTAAAWLKALCPEDYEDGTCYCTQAKREMETQEVAENE